MRRWTNRSKTNLEGAEHERGLVRIGLVAFVETGGGNDGVDGSHAEVVVVLRRQLLARQLEAVDLRVCACVRVRACVRVSVERERERERERELTNKPIYSTFCIVFGVIFDFLQKK